MKGVLVGRLTKDPVIKNNDNGGKLAAFSVAYNYYDGEKKVIFWNVQCFDRDAVFAEKHLKKGSAVEMFGEVRQRQYTNALGEMVLEKYVVAHNVTFPQINSSNGNTNNNNIERVEPEPEPAKPKRTRATVVKEVEKKVTPPPTIQGEEDELDRDSQDIDDDTIPF